MPSTFEESAVIHCELTAADLEPAVLLDLVQMEDPLGVLSIYLERTADVAARLARVHEGVDGSPARADALRSTLEHVGPVLERLLDAPGNVRGVAMFVALSTSQIASFVTRLPVASQVVVNSRAWVHPAFGLLEAGRPAGVALASDRDVELLDWRLGEARRIARVGAAQVARVADDRGWERLLVSGDADVTRRLVEALPARLAADTLRAGPELRELDLPALATAVAERLEGERARRDLELTRRVRVAALGQQRGALGLSEVLAALNEARAERVIYDPRLEYRGAVAPDGSLFAAGRGLGLVREEPRLLNRVLERALLTDARLTPVSGAAADALADAGGIAALLRW